MEETREDSADGEAWFLDNHFTTQNNYKNI
jgi:hypothetical protein